MNSQNIPSESQLKEQYFERQSSTRSRLLIIGGIFLLLIVGVVGGYMLGIKVSSKESTTIKSARLVKILPINSPTPSLYHEEKFPLIYVTLPPKGDYCNGCVDGAPGSFGSPIVDSVWVTGGYDSPSADRKWSYIHYAMKGVLPALSSSENDNFIMPQGNFLQDVVAMQVNSSKIFGKYNYSRIADQTSKDGIKIYVYKVIPTFDDNSISRLDAIFTKGDYTYYVMFDWKDHSFDTTFDQIIKSLYLSERSKTDFKSAIK